METLKTLLQNATIIQNKYNDLAEYSGENYNIFDILGVCSNELSHSSILTNLLDAKGKHGQKDVFLKLFLEQINNRFKEEPHSYYDYFKKFNTSNSTAKKEIHLGGVNFETVEGGRVDIVITSEQENIIIENKIYAGDQDQQLLRYNNYYRNQPIIYLTLEGKEPTGGSKGGLILNQDFICCSYQIDIKEWLEKCIKEMTNKPFIRETLNQYLILIQQLTNQSNNNKMSEEIRDLITVENVNLIPIINQELNNIVEELKQKIFKLIGNPKIELNENKYIDIVINQDGDGVYIGYKYFEGSENKSIIHKNGVFFKSFKEIRGDKNVATGNHTFAWYNPVGFKRHEKIEHLDKVELIKLYRDEKYFNEFVSKIKDEELEIREKFRKEIINKIS
ncbi:PD-(D/E)XK nuclease family protein [Flavobacterium ammonificans]|uniref:PD-(D/E)XK nuclease superfamily protein n=1 Tax=Flavobacterium ammonificans TaxID=1751056 RepID=A0ABN6KSY3_9FLAO|nr:PD-(D/E)XK nuclease family protein [Flavobacterium ammonificans]BDB52251.1 hypothetical protein GENT11_05630 [Flavobacterium ammonificans]